ncbi:MULTISPECIES: phosphotransferase family protein [Methylobacterium]|uniref:phosphotransferase family protein n=1 Tax=Methylobacterium TaxID=407 RepID=UPI0013ECC72D|nr:phosphotransferase family protein [Methylobacterium sp. DB0501]NGM34117.1 phosphotransferase family protein [Methylobacterium sp. DB0501]
MSGALPNPDVATTGGDAAEEAALFAWVEAVCGGRLSAVHRTSGGNRARSWAIDVARPDGAVAEVFLRYAPPRAPGAEPYTIAREAEVYRVIAAADLRAPRLIAAHPDGNAILTDRAPGIAEFRRLTDAQVKQAIAAEVMADLARLHALPVGDLRLTGGGAGGRIADHVRAELAIWRAMYAEAGTRDGLIELALGWLDATLPDPDGPVALVHGDAGPGNFLFADGRLTALIDWELAHLGDPMEDLAWFSMRCVMEPVPDFGESLRDYARAAGAPIDRARILYHRVFVSTRVVIIRHRAVTGEPANAIVSRALNRRLLVEALAEASGTPLDWTRIESVPPTPRSALFAQVLDDLRDVIVPRSRDSQAVARAKSAAKVLKYLEAWDRAGADFAGRERADLEALLGRAVADETAGQLALADAIASGRVSFGRALAFFAGQAAREAHLAAGASGGIATRHYPAIREGNR